MSTPVGQDLAGFVAGWTGRAERDTPVHLEVRAAREARWGSWPSWLPDPLRSVWVASGVARPWVHQSEAAEAAYAGAHVVMATGTASGKSLGYLMPALTEIVTSRASGGRRGAGVLYLSPTKALAQDQLASLVELKVPGLAATTHDGDSSPDQRRFARDSGEYLLTNPDMLHHSLLPDHARWSGFLSRLRYVVVDECHQYRGVFGAHVALVLRRLRRVCARYGATPTFVLASATVAAPEISGARLIGLPVRPVTDDGSARGRVTLALWQPPLTGHAGENGAPTRRSTAAEVSDLLTDLVLAGLRTLVFTRSRRAAEAVAMSGQRLLAEVDPALAARVAAYRGGYLPEDRRALEQALRTGELVGVAATNALELGIDVSGLDAVVIAGFPGTRAAFWQQVGRAGRSGQDALGVLVARDDPLDTYLVTHPEALVGAPVEAQVFDPENPYVLGPHLCAAAAELPVTEQELDLFGPGARAGLDALTDAGMLRRRPAGWFWTDRRRASDLADLRSSGGSAVRLVEERTGRLVGTVDAGSAHGTVHPDAVYLHQGETYLVRSLDLEERVAVLVRAEPDHTTFSRELTDIEISAEHRHDLWGEVRISLGEVRVSHQVVGFVRRAVRTGEFIGEEALDLPQRRLETRAVWWTVPRAALRGSGLETADLPGAAHAAEHAAIGLLPLFATCDRWDIGGVSSAMHPDTGELTVFVYDAHPGGAGFAERGYESARAWMESTRAAIAACACGAGCPACVQSPKCGNQNSPLDKAGAVRLLDLVLAGSTAPDPSA